jgi:hypothetical protein
MRVAQRYLISGLAAAAGGVGIGIAVAPVAAAECTSAGGATICAQGEVRGGGGGEVSTGPYYPYPCEDDWLCNDGGVDIVFGPPAPPIDIGRPGRPGIGPR